MLVRVRNLGTMVYHDVKAIEPGAEGFVDLDNPSVQIQMRARPPVLVLVEESAPVIVAEPAPVPVVEMAAVVEVEPVVEEVIEIDPVEESDLFDGFASFDDVFCLEVEEDVKPIVEDVLDVVPDVVPEPVEVAPVKAPRKPRRGRKTKAAKG